MDKKERDLLVFGYGLAAICLFISWRLSVKHGWALANNILSLATIFMLLVTMFNRNLLEVIYAKWMIGAMFIGKIISSIVLSVLFYGVFGLVGVFLRLIGKDLLDQKIDKKCQSYWHKRPNEEIEQKRYQQQF